MATRFSEKTVYRGVAVHDRRFCVAANLDVTTSSFTQATPEPDQPAPEQPSFMQLEATGQITTAFNGSVVTQKAGAAVGQNAGGRFVFKSEDAASDEYLGWLQANKVTRWETVATTSTMGAGFHAITLPSQRVLLVGAASSTVKVYKLEPSTEAWSSVTTFGVAASAGARAQPRLVRLPQGQATVGGRLLCFYFDDVDEGGTTYYRMSYAYSDDDGDTWTVAGTSLQGFRETWAPRDASFVYDGLGTIHATVEGVSSGDGVHLISTDFGASWTEIETIAGDRKAFRLFTDDAGVVTAIYVDGGSSNALRYVRKDSPTTSFANSATYDTGLNTSADVDDGTNGPDVAVTVDQEGYLWTFYRTATNPKRVRNRRRKVSDLSLANEIWLSDSFAQGDNRVADPIDTGDNSNILRDLVVTPFKGRLLLLSQNASSNASRDTAVSCVHLGGYTSHDWAVQTFGQIDATVDTQLGYLWLPFEKPENVSLWTQSNSGTSNVVLSDDGATISTTAGTEYYTRAGTTTVDIPILIRCGLELPATGGSLTSQVVGIEVDQRITGPAGYGIELRFNEAGYRLHDKNAGTLGTDVTTMSTSTLYDIKICMEDGEVATYWKESTATLWQEGPSGSLTSGGAPTNHAVNWGHIDTGTASSVWTYFGSCLDECDKPIGLASFTNPDDLQGRPYSYRPLYLANGMYIRSKGSTTVVGDSFGVATRYGYGIVRADPVIEPSPDVTWRTTSLGAQQVDILINSADLSRPMRCSIVVGVLNTNVRAVTVSSVTSSTPTSLGTLTAYTYGAALTWSRSGDFITITATGSTDARYIEENELVGGTFAVSGGSDYSRIVANSAGVMASGTTMRLRLRIEDATGFASSGTGDAEIWAPNLVGIIHNFTGSFDTLRFAIAAGSGANDYWEVGTLFVGPLHIFGTEYGRGLQIRSEPNVDRFEDRRGSVRKVRRGPRKRAITMTWDPHDYTPVFGADPDPAIVSANASSTEALAIRRDPYALEHIYEASEDGVIPVIYLPRVPEASSGSTELISLNLRREFLYGTIESAIQRAMPLGDELDDPVFTVSGFTIEELV